MNSPIVLGDRPTWASPSRSRVVTLSRRATSSPEQGESSAECSSVNGAWPSWLASTVSTDPRAGALRHARCQAKASCCGRAGRRRIQGRKRRAPSALQPRRLEMHKASLRRTTQFRAWHNRPPPQVPRGFTELTDMRAMALLRRRCLPFRPSRHV